MFSDQITSDSESITYTLPLRILVVDDHKLFREGLISLMKTRRDLVQVIGEAAGCEEAYQMAWQLKPDAILLDIYMPDGDGLAVAKMIRQTMPNVAVVMLTSSEVDEHVFEAVRLGASGYLLKNLDSDELFELLHGVAAGEPAMTRAMASRTLKILASTKGKKTLEGEPLTEREQDVLRLVAQGKSNQEISDQLCVSVNTVKYHLKNILWKLRLENRTQAAAFALKSGMLSADLNGVGG